MKNENKKKVEAPKSISGFPEWLPEVKILENKILEIIRRNYELCGFVPIETSAVERTETLTSKGGNEKEIYSLGRLAAGEGEGAKELALHFDLTVPLARYVAQNYAQLIFPFRRYQIQKVWRGERPQAGRFREFYQCDIDVIGDGQLSQLADAEIPSIIYRIFTEMNIGRFLIRINNRKILQGLFQNFGIEAGQVTDVMRIVDKIEKIGVEEVSKEISEVSKLSPEKISDLLKLITHGGNNAETLSILQNMEVNDLFKAGVSELATVYATVLALGVPEENLALDLRIARGLDYYTGTVYETALVEHPSVGSICSGGRYDDLASNFTEKKLPGVGISIGITRLLSRLIETGILKPSGATIAPVLITTMDQERMSDYLALASKLRAENIKTEVYLEALPLKNQLKYASRKQFMFAIIAGETEFESGTFAIKNLLTGEQQTVNVDEIVKIIKAATNIA